MTSGPRQGRGITRRAALAALPLVVSAQSPPAKGQVLSSDWARYPDPSTEFEVLRLTSSDYESHLVAPPGRGITRRSDQVLFTSTRTGQRQAFLLQLKDGRSRLLTQAAELAADALTLTYDDRALLFFDRRALQYSLLGGLREQELYRLRDGFEREAGPVSSSDGLSFYFVEGREGQSELRRLRRPGNAVETIAASDTGILDPAPNPRRSMICWRDREGGLHTMTIDGAGRRRVETPPGRVLQAHWSPDGQALLYLLDPAAPNELVSIREQQLDARTDTLVAKTSQFAAFAPNANASVFLGSSRSRANPAILILLRLTKRELLLCEHKAGEPARTAPQFAPNSQQIFFESDRHGRPALYTMAVEKLLEKTDS
jgi:oligogalacturonide lyase